MCRYASATERSVRRAPGELILRHGVFELQHLLLGVAQHSEQIGLECPLLMSGRRDRGHRCGGCCGVSGEPGQAQSECKGQHVRYRHLHGGS